MATFDKFMTDFDEFVSNISHWVTTDDIADHDENIFKSTVKYAVLGAVVGALFGSTVGFFFEGVGVVPGFALGAAAGAIIGAAFGLLMGIYNAIDNACRLHRLEQNHVKGEVTPQDRGTFKATSAIFEVGERVDCKQHEG